MILAAVHGFSQIDLNGRVALLGARPQFADHLVRAFRVNLLNRNGVRIQLWQRESGNSYRLERDISVTASQHVGYHIVRLWIGGVSLIRTVLFLPFCLAFFLSCFLSFFPTFRSLCFFFFPVLLLNYFSALFCINFISLLFLSFHCFSFHCRLFTRTWSKFFGT